MVWISRFEKNKFQLYDLSCGVEADKGSFNIIFNSKYVALSHSTSTPRVCSAIDVFA